MKILTDAQVNQAMQIFRPIDLSPAEGTQESRPQSGAFSVATGSGRICDEHQIIPEGYSTDTPDRFVVYRCKICGAQFTSTISRADYLESAPNGGYEPRREKKD